jgi:hypothetical protein
MPERDAETAGDPLERLFGQRELLRAVRVGACAEKVAEDVRGELPLPVAELLLLPAAGKQIRDASGRTSASTCSSVAAI